VEGPAAAQELVAAVPVVAAAYIAFEPHPGKQAPRLPRQEARIWSARG
jgi:hypothetical protein